MLYTGTSGTNLPGLMRWGDIKKLVVILLTALKSKRQFPSVDSKAYSPSRLIKSSL